MLDSRWKRIVWALRLYALALVAGLIVTGLIAAVGRYAPEELAAQSMRPLTLAALIAFALAPLAIVIYATVPSESGGRAMAAVAALSAVGQLVLVAVAGALTEGSLAHLPPVAAGWVQTVTVERILWVTLQAHTLLTAVTLLAMLRSIRAVAHYIRADEVYTTAHMLYLGSLLLLGFLILVGASTLVVPFVVVLGALMGAIFTAVIALGYVRVVFSASRAIGRLIYG